MIHFNSETRILAREDSPSIYNPKVSLGHIILHHLNKFPEKVFQVCGDDGVESNCGEIARQSKNFAKKMLKLGYSEGDVVGIVGKNSTFVTPVIFGCFVIALPISPIDSKDDFIVPLDITEPKIIFCDHNIAQQVKNYVKTKERKIEIVILTEKVDGFKHITDFFEDVEGVSM
jgi:4-coumarate--CoA ligase